MHKIRALTVSDSYIQEPQGSLQRAFREKADDEKSASKHPLKSGIAKFIESLYLRCSGQQIIGMRNPRSNIKLCHHVGF